MLYKVPLALYTHYLSPEELHYFGTKQANQRTDQCTKHVSNFMLIAMEALIATRYFDKSIQESATELALEAVADVIKDIKRTIELDEVVQTVLKKLETIKLWVMVPDELLNFTTIDKIYEEMDVNESASLVEIINAFDKNNKKLILEKTTSWISALVENVEKNLISYNIDENILSK